MSIYDCQLDIPKVEGLQDNKISVGRHLNLNCKGESLASFDFSKAQFKLDEVSQYSVKLFKVTKIDEKSMSLDLTFYTAGDQNVNNLILTDGATEINLNATVVKVESVLKPPTDGKPQEAFGSILPVPINIPLTYFLICLAAFVVAIVLALLKAKRLAYYRNLKNKLLQYTSVLDPDTQFYRSIRMAEKVNYPIDQLEKAFRVYNVRAYQLPMFDLNNDRVLRYFKSTYPADKRTRQNLKKLLDEFEEYSKKKDSLSFEDKNELVKKLYRYVEKSKGFEA